MKKLARVSFVLILALVAIGWAVVSCDNDGNSHGLITGVVKDSTTGSLVPAVTVTFGGSSATTCADGRFALDPGASAGVVIGSSSVYGNGYSCVFAEQVQVDAGQSTNLTVFLRSIDVSGYTTHQFDLTIRDENGTEIPDGSSVFTVVMNSQGGYSPFGFNYANPGMNTVNTATFGSDCLIAAQVNTGSANFVAMAKQVDLSSLSSSQTVSATAGRPVSVTPDAVGNVGMLAIETPYGRQIMVWADVLPTSPAGITIYNPYDYDGLWAQMTLNTSPLYSDTMYVSTSPIGPIGSNITLPLINSALGPLEGGYPPGYSIRYSPGTGTISFDEVSGAKTYLIWVYEQATPPEEPACLATIYTPETSVKLPSWLTSELSGRTLDVTVTAEDQVGTLNLDLLSRPNEWPGELQAAFAVRNGGQGPGEGYEQAITF